MTIDLSGPPIQRWLSESPNEVPWNNVSSVLNQQPANSSGQAAESLIKRLPGGTDSMELSGSEGECNPTSPLPTSALS
jgi:hypothetical protein